MNQLTHIAPDGWQLECGPYTFRVYEENGNWYCYGESPKNSGFTIPAEQIGGEEWAKRTPAALLVLFIGHIIQNKAFVQRLPPRKTIITGYRDWHDYEAFTAHMSAISWPIAEIVHGDYKGVDKLADRWSLEVLGKEPKKFPADWDTHSKKAGPLRNGQMADYVGAEGGCVAFLHPESKGTWDMIEKARDKGMKLEVIPIF